MTGFDFIFALFSLLLGLAMSEVLGGFSRVLKLHMEARVRGEKRVRVGWLVPLLALLVMLDQLTFWMQAYAVRDHLPLTYITLLVVTAIVGGYYLLSSLVFPDDPAEWPDFDIYYDQYNRLILIGLLLIKILTGIGVARYQPAMTAADRALSAGPAGTFAVLGLLVALLSMIALIFVRRRWVNVALLILLIVCIAGGALAMAIAGIGAR